MRPPTTDARAEAVEAVGTPGAGPVLEVDGLGVRFRRSSRPALSDVDLRLSPGEQVLVVGPSGSGKSTLLRAVAGIVPHAAGAAVVGVLRHRGDDVGDLDVVERSSWCAYLAQDPATSVCLARVDDEIAFPLENRAVPPVEIEARVAAALAAHGLAHLADRAVSTLSGGQLQRVALAAALVTDPDVVLLDEPTAMLDPRAAHDVGRAIAALAARRRPPAVLLVEHRLDELGQAAALPPRAIVLGSDGRLVADGPTADVLRRHAADLVRNGSWLPLGIELELVTGSPRPEAHLLASLVESPDPPRSPSPRVGGGPLLRIRGLGVRRGPRPVVAGVDLDLHAGEVTAVVGRNGSGKTSLLLALAGLLPAEDVTGTLSSPEGRQGRGVGMVFQRPEHQFVARTVGEEVRRGADAAKAEQLLVTMDLAELEGRDPYRLSGGEQRRLSLAAMAAQGHSVLLADEPTFGLDRRHAVRTAGILRALADEGRSVVLTTHDLRLAARIADRLVLLDGGRVSAAGPVEEVLRSGRLEAARIPVPELVRWWVREGHPPLRGLLQGLDSALQSAAAGSREARDEPPPLAVDSGASSVAERVVPAVGASVTTPAPDPPDAPESGGRVLVRASSDLARRGWLAERNPAIKLCLLLALTCGLFLVFDPVTPAVLYAVFTLAAPAAAGVRRRQVLRAQLPLFSFALSLLAVNSVTRGGEVLARIGPLEVTDEGLTIGAALALRMAAIAAAAVLFVLSTDGVALLRSLEQQLRLPHRAAYSVLAAHRLLETLPEEWAQARAAQQMRGAGAGMSRRAGPLARAAFALLVNALRRGERLATTLEARGLGDGPRSHWRPLRVTRSDGLLVVLTLGLAAAALAASATGGWLVGPGVTGVF